MNPEKNVLKQAPTIVKKDLTLQSALSLVPLILQTSTVVIEQPQLRFMDSVYLIFNFVIVCTTTSTVIFKVK